MLTVKDVWKIYGEGSDIQVNAIKDINLFVEKGEFLTLAGASGSGKTTLLNSIGCIDDFSRGSISINGIKLEELDSKGRTLFRRNNLGFIFQSYNLIPVLTVFENVAFPLTLLNIPKEEIAKKVNDILDQVGILSKANKKPTEISGGQQQRVAIARALVKEPAIVLADEPTANLDSKTGEDILKIMKNLNETKKVTFIFSTHDNMVMEYANRIVRIHDGVLESDTRKPQ